MVKLLTFWIFSWLLLSQRRVPREMWRVLLSREQSVMSITFISTKPWSLPTSHCYTCYQTRRFQSVVKSWRCKYNTPTYEARMGNGGNANRDKEIQEGDLFPQDLNAPVFSKILKRGPDAVTATKGDEKSKEVFRQVIAIWMIVTSFPPSLAPWRRWNEPAKACQYNTKKQYITRFVPGSTIWQ